MTVPDILSLQQGRQYSEEDVRRVVGNCPKQRFALREHAQTGQLQIRANQGHSMQVWVMLPSNDDSVPRRPGGWIEAWFYDPAG